MSTVNAEIWIVLSRRIGLKLNWLFLTEGRPFLVALPPREGRYNRFSPEMRKAILRCLRGHRTRGTAKRHGVGLKGFQQL